MLVKHYLTLHHISRPAHSRTQAHTTTRANLLKDAPIYNPLTNPTFLETLLCNIRQATTRRLLQCTKMELSLPRNIITQHTRNVCQCCRVLRVQNLSCTTLHQYHEAEGWTMVRGKEIILSSKVQDQRKIMPRICQEADIKQILHNRRIYIPLQDQQIWVLSGRLSRNRARLQHKLICAELRVL
jgi:hypothetical protein